MTKSDRPPEGQDLQSAFPPSVIPPFEDLIRTPEGRRLLDFVGRLRKAAPPAPEITEAEREQLHAILHRGRPLLHPSSSLLTDAPISDTDAARLVGGKRNRGAVHGLKLKGLLSSYGHGHGSVPTVLLHQKDGCVHWHNLTAMEKRVLSTFFDRPWRWSASAREIAVAIGIPKDAHAVADVKKAIRKLCSRCVLRLRKSGRFYKPCRLHWPVDAPDNPEPPPRTPYK